MKFIDVVGTWVRQPLVSAICLWACATSLPAVNEPSTGPAKAEIPADADQLARDPKRFERFFAPLRTDAATLSPDGKYIAYSVRQEDVVFLVIVPVDAPTAPTAKIAVINDAQSTPALAIGQAERVPARINWMRWVTGTRLVVETNRVFATLAGTTPQSPWSSIAGEVLAINFDGSNMRQLADAKRLVRTRDVTLPLRSALPRTSDGTSTTTTASESAGGAGTDTAFAPDPIYRSPRVFGLDPTSPESVLVLALGKPDYGLYRLNAISGKMSWMEEEIIDPRMEMLIDRAAKPRLGVAYKVNSKFPLPILVYTNRFGRPWTPLDDVLTDAGSAGFAITPATYFARRSVPLGFDRGGDNLYFASNQDRDTFAIYSANLRTGKRGSLAVESQGVDLWQPRPGVFPDLAASWNLERLDLDVTVDALNESYREEMASRGVLSEADPFQQPILPAFSEQRRARIGTGMQPVRNTDDTVLVFDRYTQELAGIRIRGAKPTTRWMRAELEQAQMLLEQTFRPNTVEIREWDEGLSRLLVMISGPTQPGAYHVFDRITRKVSELAPRAPDLATITSPNVLGFGFTSPKGVAIHGLITLPRVPRLKPIPTLFIAPRVPWQPFEPEYKVELQALADMGFAVVEYSGRGAWGRGVGLRLRIAEGYEDAQVEDLLATADYVAAHFAVAANRFAVVGTDHGGHVALRALELAPQRFRCAVAINAPVNLRTWLDEMEWAGGSAYAQLIEPMFGDRPRQKAAPLVRDADQIIRPALLFNFRGPTGTRAVHNYTAAKQFAIGLSRRVPTTEIVDVGEDFMKGLPQARGAAYARIEEFLNANVYDFAVKAGATEVDEPR